MYSKTFIVFIVSCGVYCNNNHAGGNTSSKTDLLSQKNKPVINPYPTISAIPLPKEYKRVDKDSNSFAAWLLQIPLKKEKTVYLYDGRLKTNQAAQFAVLNISTGDKNLQQCADAVMRLRAEYLFATQQYDAIVFYDNDGKAYLFKAPFTKAHLHQYLQTVFGMCGTASLAKQLHKVNTKDIQPGDVLIRGGFPGHAVLVMDAAADAAGNKIFMLAQSYMPAQDIHVLVNVDDRNSPWYHLTEGKKIETPEYVFEVGELRRW
jgi:maltoporin